MLEYSLYEKNVVLNAGLGIVREAPAWLIPREDSASLCVYSPVLASMPAKLYISKRRLLETKSRGNCRPPALWLSWREVARECARASMRS